MRGPCFCKTRHQDFAPAFGWHILAFTWPLQGILLMTSWGNSRKQSLAGGLPRRGRQKRKGAAVVEFALAAPLLATLVVGMFEVSRGIMVKQVLSDAARKACRTGIQPNKANTDITSEVNNILSDNNISSSGATITILVNGSAVDASTAQQNDQISVQVSIPVSKIYWAGTIFLPASAITSEAVVMMRQG
jgi:Flp pilus assembly protein TadG